MKDVKKALRDRVFSQIEKLDQNYISESDEDIFKAVLGMPEYKSAGKLFVYCSTDREPDTRRLIDEALRAGKQVSVPRIVSKGIMEAAVIESVAELVPGRFDIPTAPEDSHVIPKEELDLVIVPAVAFDREGYRLGYGGGYYDRFLAGIPAVTVGLARWAILLDEAPREAHDIKVRYVVTEKRVITCE
jgi:5-formyltetrahydrofolate cyclo-ligase